MDSPFEIIVDVYINNKLFKALIDTGCQLSSFIDNNNLKLISIDSKLFNVKLSLFKKDYTFTFEIIKSLFVPSYDLILGIDFLESHKINIDFNNFIIYSFDFVEPLFTNNNKNNNNKNNKNNLILKNNKLNTNINMDKLVTPFIVINIKIKNNSFKAFIDTGSNGCYINESVINKCNLSKFINYKNKCIYQQITSEPFETIGVILLNMLINKYNIPCNFHVIEDHKYDIILDNLFLVNNKVLIDFNNKILNFNEEFNIEF